MMADATQCVRIWALVPVKRLEQAKTRLGASVDRPGRARLMLAMVADLLDVLAGSSRICGVAVVTADPRVRQLAIEQGCVVIDEAIEAGYASAASAGTSILAREHGADAVLVMPGDLPMVRVEDVDALCALPLHPPVCRLAQASDGLGTNAVLLAPPTLIPLQFGEGGSFRRHLNAALDAGAAVEVVENGRIAHDVDWPSDLARVVGAECGVHVRGALQALACHPASSAFCPEVLS